MRKIAVIGIILVFTELSAQPHGRRSWGGQQQQMKDAPKIGVVYGTVVDSASALPVPYASVYVISQRGGTIVTGGITKETGEFHITEIPLGRYMIVVESVSYTHLTLPTKA